MQPLRRDWFAEFRRRCGATGATGATSSGQAQQRAGFDPPAPVATRSALGATGATTATPVARVALSAPAWATEISIGQGEQIRRFPVPVALVASVAPEDDGVDASYASVEVREPVTRGLPAERHDPAEECVGVAEYYDARAPREWAERLARLDPDVPPGDVPRKRWLMFLDDCGRFIDQWAKQAVVMGWRVHDLFGCDARRPFARLDRAGLLWLAEGRDIVALTGEIAVIGGRSRARLTHLRMSSDGPGRVLAWELIE